MLDLDTLPSEVREYLYHAPYLHYDKPLLKDFPAEAALQVRKCLFHYLFKVLPNGVSSLERYSDPWTLFDAEREIRSMKEKWEMGDYSKGLPCACIFESGEAIFHCA